MVYNRHMEKEGQEVYSQKLDTLSIFKKIFSYKNILFIVLTFLVLPQSFMENVFPYGYVIFGVAALFNVPLFMVLLSGIISTLVFTVPSFVLLKMFISFVVFTLLTALVNVEGVTKKNVILIKLLFSVISTEIIAMVIRGFSAHDLIIAFYAIMVTTAMYLVFSSGVYVILNLKKNFVYSKEESLAMLVVVMITIGFLKPFQIYGFSLLNTISIALVLMYGYRNGAIMASAAGLVAGLILSISTEMSVLYITVLTFSGFVSGFLNRFGKLGVIIGFITANLVINYWVNGFSSMIVRLSEVIFASFAIMIIPKKLEEKLDKIFDKNSTLNRAYENVLDSSGLVRNRLNAVSEVFDDLSNVIVENDDESKEETKDIIKKYIINYLDNNFIEYKKEIENLEKLSLTYATKLEKNEDIKDVEFLFDIENSEKINKEIYEVYSSVKLVRIVKTKEKQNSKILSEQYKEVSKILNNISRSLKQNKIKLSNDQIKVRNELKMSGYSIYEDEYILENSNIEYTFVTDILNDIDEQKKEISALVSSILEQNMIVKYIFNSSKTEKSKIKLMSKPKYDIQVAIESETKTGEEVSGDSYISMELEDMHHVNVISDGMSSGKEAKKASKLVINTLEKLLKSGFEKEKCIELVNSVMKLKSNEEVTSTLDMVVYDLKSSTAGFIKVGAAPTYILEDKKITTITSMNIPIGLTESVDYIPIEKIVASGSIIIQITDGVIDENEDIKNNFLTKYMLTIDTSKSVKQVAEEIKKLVLKKNQNKINDDFTIIVSKIIDGKK